MVEHPGLGSRLGSSRRLALPVVVVLFAAALRIYQLASVPPGFFYDESADAVDALRVLAGVHPIFFVANQGREPLNIYLQALTFALIGPSPFAARLPSVALGVLTVAATYTTFRAFAGPGVGVIGASLLGASFWHLSLSRLAIRTNSLPLFPALAAFWLWKGVRTGQARYFAIGGALTGVDLYTYIPARLVPPLIGLWLLGCVVVPAWRGETAWRPVLAGTVIAFFTLAIVATPLAAYFARHPDEFLGRIQSVAATASPASSNATLIEGFLAAGRAIVWSGDSDPMHDLPGRPLVDLPLAGLGALGALLALRRWRDGTSLFVIAWCVAMLAPAALSTDPSHALRLVGELPFILYLPALGLDWLRVQIVGQFGRVLGRLDVGNRALLGSQRPTSPAPNRIGQLVGWTVVGVVLLGSALATVHDYFQIWAVRPDTYAAFQTDLLDSLRLTSEVPPGQTTFVTARIYDGEPIPLAMLPTIRSRVNSYMGLNTFVQPANPTGPVYYVVASSMVPPVGLPAAAHLTLLDTARDRIGDVSGQLYRADATPDLPADRPLAFTIGSTAALTGADAPRQLTPGSQMTVAFHWTVRGPLPPGQWVLFAHLIQRANQHLLAQDYNLGLPADQWRPGTRVISYFFLNVPGDAPAAVADLNFGIFDPDTGRRLAVSTSSGTPAGDTVAVGPLRIVRPAPPPPPPEHPLAIRFGDSISLIGYDLQRQPNGAVQVRLHWRAAGPVSQDYTVFTHLLDAQGKLAVGSDSQPDQGTAPTSTWNPGDVILDEHTLAPAPGAETPTLEVGLYLLATGQRVPVADNAGHSLGDALRLSNGPSS